MRSSRLFQKVHAHLHKKDFATNGKLNKKKKNDGYHLGLRYRGADAKRRFRVPEGHGPGQPRPDGGPPKVRPPRGLPEVLRLSEWC